MKFRNVIHYNMFLYFCLIRSRKTVDYLKWFPHYLDVFSICRIRYGRLVTRVHSAYMKKYIKKEYCTNKYDWFLRQIHNTIYIPSVQSRDKKIVTKDVVKEYLYTLSPLQLTHLVVQM